MPDDGHARLEDARGALLREAREIAGISVENDRIEHVALYEPAKTVVDAAQLGSSGCGGEQRLLDRQTRLVHEDDLLEVAAVLDAADVVGPGRELDPVLLRQPHAGADVEPKIEDLPALRGRERALLGPPQDVAHRGQSGNEPAAGLRHDGGLLLGEEASVLDRADAGPDGV